MGGSNFSRRQHNWFKAPAPALGPAPAPAPAPAASPAPAPASDAATNRFRAGDVVTLDIAEFIAKRVNDNPSSEEAKSILKALGKAAGAKVTADDLRAKIIIKSDLGKLTQRVDSNADTGEVRLATKDGKGITGGTPAAQLGKLLSADPKSNTENPSQLTNSKDKNVSETAVIVLFREITDKEIEKLRTGNTLSRKTLNISIGVDGAKELSIDLNVAFDDYDKGKAIFFGDRPLENPGYSPIKLSADITQKTASGSSGDTLDIYRVEQRLAYLGFPAFGTAPQEYLPDSGGTPVNFKVDGVWGDKELHAAYLFSKVINFTTSTQLVARKGAASHKQDPKKNIDDVASFFEKLDENANKVVVSKDSAAKGILTYLNAYNAPHWVDIWSMVSGMKGWTRQTTSEHYGSSWMLDAMTAANYAPAELRKTGVKSSLTFEFNSATDANAQHTPFGHGSHDVGMALDLGVGLFIAKAGKIPKLNPDGSQVVNPKTGKPVYVDKDGPQLDEDEKLTLDTPSLKKTLFNANDPSKGTLYSNIPDQKKYDANEWSYENAVYLSGLLSSGNNADKFANDQQGALRDFLALYDITKTERSTWLEPKLVNGGDKKSDLAKYLFGTTSGTGVMIPKIYIGGTGSTNPYKNINDILSHLGIKSEAYISHHTHFHVYFTPPDAKSFGKALSTEDTTADGMLPPNSEATNLNASKIQSLIDEIGALMDALPQNYSASDSVYRTIPAGGAGVVTPSRIQTWDMDCQEVGAGAVYTDSAYNNIPAAWLVLDSLGYKRDAKTGSFPDSVVSAAILGTTVVTAPKHGRLMEQGQAGIGLSFQFSADSSYQGMDQFALRVDARDKTGKAVSYLLNYKVAVVEGITNEQLPSACERWMKQSRKSASISFPAITELGPLPDARLAETYGLGIDARIVLNDSSAINWYLDPTPLDNTDDFLPTADKTIWRAKAGGAADGKMDLLSVLLHEYGHVLGLDHAGDSSDFMAATLQPGERRLPTQAELAWMAQRIVELKVASGSESGGNDPSNPTAPTQPGLPVGGRTVSSSRAARRSTGDGSAAPQFATGVNVSLLNGSFGQSGTPNGAGWTTQGDVSFTSDGATLGESGGRQARLLQGFAVGANDRLLSFTLAGPGLQANAGGPGDAFEVALLDADTGLPLAGHVDLDGSDALLNRQTARNGQAAVERLASSVRKQINADGSVTYLVMLAPELTGKSVLLSFDLLGFAAADSHVVVRDVHTLADTTPNQAPTAADGQASDVEDAALVLSWTSFAIIDPDSRPDLLQVEITALPVDGELQRQQADGSWAAVAVGERFSQADLAARGLRFVPAANASGGAGYFGSAEGNRQSHYAHIGFKAYDGELYSPAARLVIDIAAVADAPTLSITGGATVTGLEDTALALHAIVAGLVDNDGSETLVLTLTGLPDGFTLTDGTRSFTPSVALRVVDLAGWQLDALALTPPRDFNGSVALQLQATAIEGATGEYATTSQLLIAQFVAVADAPTLTLSARDIAVSRELLATSWETPANDPATAENPLKSSTAVAGPTLEGWTVLPAVSGKQAAFEILAANDRTVNYGGNALRAQSMPGNGSQWLTLRNGRATLAYQTLGIERTVDTIDGAVYTLGFDYAGGPGFAVANTAIGIYVDGVKVGGYAGTSPTTALNWESLSFTFTGNGQMRRVAIVLEGGDAIAGGAVPQRSANIDDIHLVETLPVGTALLYGLADTAIALPKVAAEPTDSFGSEALALTLGGLPTGAVLSDGVHTAAGGTSVELAGWDLTHLSATPPAGFTGDMSLTVRAASVETGNGASSSVSQAFVVRVLPGTPVATPAGINPFVVTTAAAQATQSQAGSQSVAPPSAAALDLLASARGQMGSAAEPAPLPKTAAEIAQAETDRASSLSDAWLKDLEERAKAQWQQLVGGK